MSLNAERVRELLSYEPETGVFRWKIRTSNRVHVGDVAGWDNGDGYRVIRIDGRLYLAHRLAWLHVHGQWPVAEVDHVDGNPANNRIANLRKASRSENLRNQKRHADNTSGLKGVTWRKKNRRWEACIWLNRRSIYLGLFDTAEAAHAAYCEASERLHGDFGRTE